MNTDSQRYVYHNNNSNQIRGHENLIIQLQPTLTIQRKPNEIFREHRKPLAHTDHATYTEQSQPAVIKIKLRKRYI